jgi:hypothetical protein
MNMEAASRAEKKEHKRFDLIEVTCADLADKDRTMLKKFIDYLVTNHTGETQTKQDQKTDNVRPVLVAL